MGGHMGDHIGGHKGDSQGKKAEQRQLSLILMWELLSQEGEEVRGTNACHDFTKISFFRGACLAMITAEIYSLAPTESLHIYLLSSSSSPLSLISTSSP